MRKRRKKEERKKEKENAVTEHTRMTIPAPRVASPATRTHDAAVSPDSQHEWPAVGSPPRKGEGRPADGARPPRVRARGGSDSCG